MATQDGTPQTSAPNPDVPARDAAGSRITRRSLHDAATERLRDMIIEGAFMPGERLSERELCERFGISRTPLREALKVLASEGLVDLRPNRGAAIAPLTLAELEQTVEVLAALEALAGGLAARRASDADLAEVKALHYEMLAHHARGDLPSYFKCNQAIHRRIMQATYNAPLAATYQGLNARIRRFRYMANLSRERWDTAVAEHERILDALVNRDEARLSHLLAQHLRDKCAHVKATLEQTQRADGAGGR